MKRLSQQFLTQASANVLVPAYDRASLRAGIIHLGIGAFHRAHQAFYTDQVLHHSPDDWLIVGCSLRSSQVHDQLQPQDGLYTLAERGPDVTQLRIIGAVQKVLVAHDNPTTLISAMADANIRIFSLTITEKGYCHDPATGDLNIHNEDIQHDLKQLHSPRTAIGFIVAALLLRQHTGRSGVSLLSCDNLPHNGKVLKAVVTQFARMIQPGLVNWIDQHCCFPATMIDRIVPATTDEDRAEIALQLGFQDEGLVIAEPFSQWVIEDHFCQGRPAWETAGALLVKDVAPYENIKLRLLNGTHSLLAYTGYLAGIATISEVMRAPGFLQLATLFMAREAGQTLLAPAEFDLAQYQQQLIERFSNPALKHRTWQIAMDGSQKIPQRWLSGLQAQLEAGGPIAGYGLGLAAWIMYISGVDCTGNPIDVRDPYAQQFKEIWQQYGDQTSQLISAILGIDRIFDPPLVRSSLLQQEIAYWLTLIRGQGVVAAIRQYVAPH